ncbi:MAG: rod shape-determining protein RodA [Armatimonadota bacterium]
MRNKGSSSPDYGLLIAVLALLCIGLPAIFSASHVTDGFGKVLRQLIWAVVGLAGLRICSLIDYRTWWRYWRLFYVLIVIALLATVLFATEVNGARSWINMGSFRLQPSEFAKLVLILTFGSLLTRYGSRVREMPFFTRGLLFFMAPTFLVLAQPDFGTGMVLCAIWFAMVLFAGTRWWMLVGVCVGAAMLFTAAWHVGLIKDYQKKRLDFIHADPTGVGYHQRQALIAIGAGEFFGKGYLRGTQARRGFLPEQDTDFIYAVIGEEFGFMGCFLVLVLYLFILFRMLRIAEEADTPFGQLIVIGVTTMLVVHIIINIGMTLTLLPVTGVPLPFVSYGGSNLLTNLLAIGVVLNVSRHRQTQRTWALDEALVRL